MDGRGYCIPDDIKGLVIPVFSHRVIVSPKYSSPLEESQEAESVIRELLERIEVPL